MSGIFTNQNQRTPLKQVLDYDREQAVILVEQRIRDAAYNFALGINLEWKEDDILRDAKKLAIDVAALRAFGDTFDELVKEIEGARV